MRGFVHSVCARSAAPGGGSVSALVGALGLGLSAMVGKLTYGKRVWVSLDGEMRALIPPVDKACREMVDFVDADTSAFNDYMVSKCYYSFFTEFKGIIFWFLGCAQDASVYGR